METVGKIVLSLFGVSVLTGGWALWAQYGPWAIFIAFGVFYFGAAAYVVVAGAYSVWRLPNKLYVSDMGAIQWQRPDDAPKVGIQLQVAVNSMASFEIFFEVADTDFEVGGVQGTPSKTRVVRGVIAPNGYANISLATVVTNHNFENGRLVFKVKYGREKGKYTHQMDTTMEFFPQAYLAPEAQGFLHILRNVIDLEYRRLPDA